MRHDFWDLFRHTILLSTLGKDPNVQDDPEVREELASRMPKAATKAAGVADMGELWASQYVWFDGLAAPTDARWSMFDRVVSRLVGRGLLAKEYAPFTRALGEDKYLKNWPQAPSSVAPDLQRSLAWAWKSQSLTDQMMLLAAASPRDAAALLERLYANDGIPISNAARDKLRTWLSLAANGKKSKIPLSWTRAAEYAGNDAMIEAIRDTAKFLRSGKHGDAANAVGSLLNEASAEGDKQWLEEIEGVFMRHPAPDAYAAYENLRRG